MSVSPSLYGPIWSAISGLLNEAAKATPLPPGARLKYRLFGASMLADRASDPSAPLRPSIDSIDFIVRAFTRETTGPAQNHCFAALAMIPALRSSASSSPSRTR